MSKQIKLRCCLFFMDLNHSIAEAVLFHWLNLAVLMILLLILSRILLLILPISDLVGVDQSAGWFVGEVRFVVFDGYECFFVSCLVYPVVYTQFRRDVFVFCVDGLEGVRLCFFVGLGDVLFEKVVVCGWF